MGQVSLILLGIVAGAAGTLVMDVANHLLSRAGLLVRIDMRMIGRMSAGWLCGRFRYEHPDELPAAPNEQCLGLVTHYAISVVFALAYVIGWHILFGSPASAFGALVFGVMTVAAPLFIVFPALVLGIFGRRSPNGIRAPLSSLVNHAFFGLGMSLAILLF
jgi:uncharacterized membrane protein YeaQ/YmgE (transglycosylase-associated protein family)